MTTSKQTFYFDMDGTVANTYGIPNWLERLRVFDPSPYIQAEPLLNMRTLARYLNRLQKKGHKLGVISWLSKETNANYDETVRTRKLRWLKKHLGSVKWDEIHLVAYGRPKHYVARDKNGIIFDDNEEVRKGWGDNARTEKQIISTLKAML